MPCPETSITLHHKRRASDIENGPECSMDSLARLLPGNLPSLSGSMKRMKIHENDDGCSPISELIPSFSAGRMNCGSCSSNSGYKSFYNSDNSDDHSANVSISSPSSPLSQFFHSLPMDLETIFRLDDQGNNPLHTSILRHNTNLALMLIEQAPSFEFLSIENAEGQTALHLAALTNQPSLVRALICAGAAVDALDNNLKTPLHLACEFGYPDVVRCLLRPVDYTETLGNRYTIPFQRIPQNMDLTDDRGKKCIELALDNKHVTIANILIDSGAFIFSSGLKDFVLNFFSRHMDNDDDDDSDEEDSKQDTTPFRSRREESDNNSRGRSKASYLEHDDHLSDRDLSIVL